jgi:hypothetical protein
MIQGRDGTPAYETCPFIWDRNARYPTQEEMRAPGGMTHILAHDGRKDILPFLLDVAISAFEGRIYVAWYNSTDAEICGTSLIRGRVSADGAKTWSEPFTIAGSLTAQGEHYVPANFFPCEGRLYALITEMSGKNITTALNLFERSPGRDERWQKIARISGGFICNAPPVRMSNGSWIAGGWTPMKNETPAFPVVLISHGDDIASEWRCRFLYDPLRPGAVRIRCAEISLHADGAVVTAYVRNDQGPSYVFESTDHGETWSAPMSNPMSIGGSKIFAGTLSTGSKYLVYNEDRGYFVRTMLVIAVAGPGERAFRRVYRLFDGDEPGLGRGAIWFYPCACELNGFLYVACTLRERDDVRSAVIARIPLDSL